ncbi:hypothetical protein M1D88_18540 [Arthrobacter sp. R1-13]
MIRPARPDELSRLQDIEVAAGAMFRLAGMDAIAEDPPPELSHLAAISGQAGSWWPQTRRICPLGT